MDKVKYKYLTGETQRKRSSQLKKILKDHGVPSVFHLKDKTLAKRLKEELLERWREARAKERKANRQRWQAIAIILSRHAEEFEEVLKRVKESQTEGPRVR